MTTDLGSTPMNDRWELWVRERDTLRLHFKATVARHCAFLYQMKDIKNITIKVVWIPKVRKM